MELKVGQVWQERRHRQELVRYVQVTRVNGEYVWAKSCTDVGTGRPRPIRRHDRGGFLVRFAPFEGAQPGAPE